MFRVNGRWNGENHSLTWDDGKVTASHPDVQRLFDVVVNTSSDVGVPTGERTQNREQHLRSPWSSRVLMEQCLDEVDDVTGEVPEVENEPGRVY